MTSGEGPSARSIVGMHATSSPRSRALRLLAACFSLGLLLSMVPLPKFTVEPVAAAEVVDVPAFSPLDAAAVAAQRADADKHLAEEISDDRVSAVEPETAEFNMIGVALPAVPDEPVMIRLRDPQGGWGEWNELSVDPSEGPDPDSAEGRRVRESRPAGEVLSEPIWVGGSVGYEVSVGAKDAEGVRVALVREETRRTVVDAVPLAAATSIGPPFTVNTRASWGARGAKEPPSIASAGLRLAVVHHTASTNAYSASQVPSILRSMQAFHMDGNGWNDIGYNFLVDRFGNVWEGRGGGIDNAVIGAHAGGFNTSSVGVSVIGNFSSTAAPSAARESVSRVVGWRLWAYRVDPTTRVDFTSGGSTSIPAGQVVNLPRVVGHRDVGQTGCPGSLHGQLGWIRTRARDWFNHMERLVSPSGNIDAVRVNGSTVEVSGWARDPDVPDPAIVHVVLAGRLNVAHANGYRPDIGGANPGYGDNLGWGAGFWEVPEGTHRLCVTVINQGVGGGNRLLGCRDVVVK